MPIEKLPGVTIRSRWGRLLSEEDAAEYLGISRTTLRDLDLTSKRIGRRVLYDIRTLERFADQLGEAVPQPGGAGEAPDAGAVADEERRFFERRRRRGQN